MKTSNSQEFSALFICYKWYTVLDYILYNGNKYQLMTQLPNQFNKRTGFFYYWHYMIMVIPKPNFDFFDKSVFKSIVFLFFSAIILIMAIFNFQFWVSIKIGSWYNLTCCTFLLFSHFLICCLRNQTVLELWNYMLFS